jgi:DNA-binding CsgD family transcriptional regulator
VPDTIEVFTSPQLKAREKEVLGHLAEGHDYRAIAAMLGLGPSTVRQHIEKLRYKLEAKNTAHAVALGFRYRILTLDHIEGN